MRVLTKEEPEELHRLNRQPLLPFLANSYACCYHSRAGSKDRIQGCRVLATRMKNSHHEAGRIQLWDIRKARDNRRIRVSQLAISLLLGDSIGDIVSLLR